MRIVILSSGFGNYSTQRLYKTAKARGIDADVWNPLEDTVEICNSGSPHKDYMKENVVFIPRVNLINQRYIISYIRYLESYGSNWVMMNPSLSIMQARDKVWALQIVANKGYHIPYTTYNPVGSHYFHEGIIKTINGTHGVGVIKTDNEMNTKSVIDVLKVTNQDFFMQERVIGGHEDIRALVIDYKVVAAMRRTAKHGEFRANVHQGADIESVELYKTTKTRIQNIAKLFKLRVCGVDIIETPTNPVFLEINASPGLEGIEEATGVDIAGSIIDSAERLFKHRLKI